MPDGPRPASRLESSLSWTVVTDAPLLGLSLAREAGVLLAWDEASHFSLISPDGSRRAQARAPEKILSAAISDDGALVALLLSKSRLMLLGPDLQLVHERTGPSDATSLAVDPHGRYVAVGTKTVETYFFTRHGKPAGKFETRQPLSHLKFVPSRPILLGAATYGLLVAVDLDEGGATGSIDADVMWEEKLSTTVGRLATSGDGGIILVSCFTHGVQRYDLQGQNEGSYHLGGTAAHAVPDFTGRSFAVASTEGELSLLNSAGNVRWKTSLARPLIALELDALGRFLYYGQATGEVCRIDFDGSRPGGTPQARRTELAAAPRAGSVRPPDWIQPLAQTDDQAETAVLCVLDDPPRIGVFTNSRRLEVFELSGKTLGQAPECPGVGRILRTASGWIAAATDRYLVVYDARRNGAQRLDLSLVALTHLALKPESFGLAVVQERDRLGRATTAGRWVWRQELRSPVEDLAIGPANLVAVTTDSGRLQVYDAAGEPAGTYTADPTEPLCLIEAPAAAPAGLAWVTLARRNQVLRGHSAEGRVLWESPVPWEGWQLHRVGPRIVIVAPDGRTLSYEGSGHLRAQGRPEESQAVFFPGPDGEALRVTRQGVHLICSDLAGNVRWRAVSDSTIGPMAAASPGVVAMLGRSLAWFGSTPETAPR